MKIKLHLLATTLILAAVFSGCTVTQKNLPGVTSSVGNNVQGGFLGEWGIGSDFKGYLFEKGSIDHYNALVGMYGGLPQTINDEPIGFVPAIQFNDGVQALRPGLVITVWHLGKPVQMKSDGLYSMDREHAKKYKLMRDWEDNGIPEQSFLKAALKAL